MNFQRKSVIFSGLRQVEFKEEPVDLSPSETGILFKTSYSCISTGTELAKLTGLQKVEFPLCLGNRAVGRVIDPGQTDLKEGSLILAHAAHTSVLAYDGFYAPLPEDADCPEAALLGMAMVSLVGVQQAPVQVGDFAVVTGAGLVGNLAAQLLELSGARVILVDQVAERLKIAAACGISHTVTGTPLEISRRVEEITGAGAQIGLECTGVPAAIRDLPALMARRGHVVLVGSPRGDGGDMTPFLNHFHLWQPHGDLTLVGAHEWKTPPHPTPFVKHSMTRNVRILADLMLTKRLLLKPLLSHVFHPRNAAEAYRCLDAEKQGTLGVVFDWTKENPDL